MKEKILQLEEQIIIANTQKKKIDSLNELGQLLRFIDELHSMKISEEAYSLSITDEFEKNPYLPGLAYSLSNLCELNFVQGKTPLSFSQGQEALKIFEQIEDFEGQALILSLLGFNHYAIGNYPQAFDCEKKSIQYAQKAGKRDIEGHSLGNLASIYSKLDKFEQMRESYALAITILREINDFTYLCIVKNNMAVAYMRMGDFDLALKSGLESLEISKKYGLYAAQSYIRDTIGTIYLTMENYVFSKKYLEEALYDKNSKINDYVKSVLMVQLSRLHMKLDTGSATDYLHQALELSEKLGTKNEQIQIHKLLSEVFEQSGDLPRALSHFKKFHDLEKKSNTMVNETSQLHDELMKAQVEIKILQGIIPICCNCKKIRDDSGYWNQIEAYISEHSEAQFSHGMCPDCLNEIYGDEKWYIDSLKEKK